jgi:3-oxoacyl-[acyl-carrier protein] reductase
MKGDKNMHKFEGKYAIATGGTDGITKESIICMARKGLSGAIIAGRNKERGIKAAEEIKKLTVCECYYVQTDVSKPEDIVNLFKVAKSKFPTIQILVNGAGVCPSMPIETIDAQEWDRVMNINLRSMHLCILEALKFMKPQKYGKIINVSSAAGRIGGTESSIAYSVSKGGMITATKCYAKAYGVYNINVNSICPGAIKTNMIADFTYANAPESLIKKIIPLGRLGKVEDCSGVIEFLASNDSDYITGCSIDVNGGVFMN